MAEFIIDEFLTDSQTVENELDVTYSIGSDGERAKALIKQILSFARQSELEAKPIQVKHILKETLKLLRATVPSSVEIKENIESDATIVADYTQIHQVIMILCTNAEHSLKERSVS